MPIVTFRSRIGQLTCYYWLFITKAASYSPTFHCSTIGVSGLNFSVRNGKRCDTATITTNILFAL